MLAERQIGGGVCKRAAAVKGRAAVVLPAKADYVRASVWQPNRTDMTLRDRINAALKDAMKDKEKERLATLRLINAAIKERDIVSRTEGRDDQVGDEDVMALLAKMIKQRHESAKVYEEGGRIELAEKELAEIKFIEVFLPKQLNEAETAAAIKNAITETGASSLRDMGPVMAALKARYTGQLDFGKVGPLVKAQLG